MLDYLKRKKEALEAQKIEPSTIYEDLERQIDEYRSRLYAEKDAEITEHNKLVDAKVSVLDEIIAETESAMVDEVVDEGEKSVDDSVDETFAEETEQKESEI